MEGLPRNGGRDEVQVEAVERVAESPPEERLICKRCKGDKWIDKIDPIRNTKVRTPGGGIQKTQCPQCEGLGYKKKKVRRR